ncbi:hypothetical protein OSTOST_01431 [Ostertagia ostertagi]
MCLEIKLESPFNGRQGCLVLESCTVCRDQAAVKRAEEAAASCRAKDATMSSRPNSFVIADLGRPVQSQTVFQDEHRGSMTSKGDADHHLPSAKLGPKMRVWTVRPKAHKSAGEANARRRSCVWKTPNPWPQRCKPINDDVTATRKPLKPRRGCASSTPLCSQYDEGAHITTALAVLKHINVPSASTVAHQQVFSGLPSSFGRVHTEVDYNSEVIVYAYGLGVAGEELAGNQNRHGNNLYGQILPSGIPMRLVLIALERHLQPGERFIQSPYEGSSATEWSNMGRMYGSPFNGRQVLLFLEKLHVMPEIKVASNELKEARR